MSASAQTVDPEVQFKVSTAMDGSDDMKIFMSILSDAAALGKNCTVSTSVLPIQISTGAHGYASAEYLGLRTINCGPYDVTTRSWKSYYVDTNNDGTLEYQSSCYLFLDSVEFNECSE